MANYSLQILHASDMEGGGGNLLNAPSFVSIVDYLEDQAENSLFLSSGDLILPGPYMAAAGDYSLRAAIQRANEELYGLEAGTLSDLREGAGRIDVTLAHLLSTSAITLGNHEFDQGTSALADLLASDIRGADLSSVRWLGTQFPYLSANLDFSGDHNLAWLYTDQILNNSDYATDLETLDDDANGAKIAPATIIEEGGELIGVIGGTTQILESISSTGGVQVEGTDSNDMALLAQQLQVYIDQLTAQGVNKIVVMTHLQQIQLEEQLAPLLEGVDILMAGGSNALLADSGTETFPGMATAAYEDYPILTQDKNGDNVVLVNTDGGWRYVGQLTVEFDENGKVIAESITDESSTVYTATEETAASLWGDLATAFADGSKGDIAQDLVDAVGAVVSEKDGITFGSTDVYLQGERAYVRTEETNLGNLTADANLWYAQQYDDSVQVSIKNGGGIREPIGTTYAVGSQGDYELRPPQANEDAGKEKGEVSQLDIESSLRFNNDLSLLSLTRAQLVNVLEHAVAASGEGATPGQFAQVSGIEFSFDWSRDPGDRIISAAITDGSGEVIDVLMENGRFQGDADTLVRIVTLGFLADGGDSYPFAEYVLANGEWANRVDLADAGLSDGSATEAGAGTEQDAFAEYLLAHYSEAAYAEADTSKEMDTRIQNLNYREDTILEGEQGYLERIIDSSILQATISTTFDSGVGEGGSEVVAVDDGRLYSTNGTAGRIDVYDMDSGSLLNSLDLTGISGFDGVTSVAIANGIVAAAVEIAGGENGVVALFSADTGALLSTVDAGGVLPDMITFNAQGDKLLVAIEAEPLSAENDPMGGVSIIDLSSGAANATTNFIDFSAFDGQEDSLREAGVRLFPGKSPSTDFEPEYISISPDGTKAYVTLQEANTVAVLDLATESFTELLPLGTTDHSLAGNELDASNRDDAINPDNYPVFGLRMPDAIASFEIDGTTYFATANEGDARDEDERVEDLILDPEVFPNAAELQDEAALGRLKVSSIDGDTDGDGDYDELYSYGSRSFTIYDADGNEIFDSGNEFESILAEIRPELFNQDEGDFDDRSDDKGPEPEAIAVGEIADELYAFIGLERDNGIMVYNIDNPANSKFVGYIDAESYGHLAPEVIKFIPAEESSSGIAQLAVAFEVSGTAALIDLEQIGTEDRITTFTNGNDEALIESLYRGILGREGDETGRGYWIDAYDNGATTKEIVEAFVYSQEYIDNAPSDNGIFLDALYQNLFGREADAPGKTFWNEKLGQGAERSWVISSFIESDENQTQLESIAVQGISYTPYDVIA